MRQTGARVRHAARAAYHRAPLTPPPAHPSAAALELRALGYDVTVVDGQAAAGGRAQRRAEPGGFVFDTGPSWYWMPDVFEDVFARYGAARAAHYNLTRLDPAYQLVLPPAAAGGAAEVLDVPGTLEGFIAFATALDPASDIRAFMADGAEKYDLGVNHALWSAPEAPLARWMFSPAVGPALIFRTLREHIARFARDARLRTVLEWPSQFLGLDAGAAPSLYALLSWSGHAQGTWLPSPDGMAAPALALQRVASAAGVRFEFGTHVTRIEGDGRHRVTRVHTAPAQGGGSGGGARIRDVDALVAAADYEHVEQVLMPADLRRHDAAYWGRVAMTPRVVCFTLCVTARVPALSRAHTLFLDDAEWPFYASSDAHLRAPDAAAASIFVLVPLLNESAPVPPHARVLARVLARLAIDPAAIACGADGYGPAEYTADFHAFRGNAFGLANTLAQTMWLKPPMASLADNAVFAGHLTHPGPGVPPALVSGIVAARLLHASLEPRSIARCAPALALLAALLLAGALARTARARAALALHRGGKTYFAAAAAMPLAEFFRIAAHYELFREADDVVDCVHAAAETRAADLDAFAARVLATPESRLGHAPALWHTFFRAMRSDAGERGAACATRAELIAYMDGSAAVLGEFLLPTLGGAASLRAPARALGYAFQLTNMLRDVREDAALGRRYLPADACARHGVPDPAAADPSDPRFRALMEEMFALADAWYAEADAGIAALPEHTRPAIALARRSYHRLHDAIRGAGYNLVPRVVVPWSLKLADAAALLPPLTVAKILTAEVLARVAGVAATWALPAAAVVAVGILTEALDAPRGEEVTYASVHVRWTLPFLAALVAAAIAVRSARPAPAYTGHAGDAALAPKWTALLVFVAFVYTTPWDAALIARGVWASTAVAGAWAGIPFEELAFFAIATFAAVVAWLVVWPARWRDAAPSGAGQLYAAAGLLGVAAAGGLAAVRGGRVFYMGALLAWAAPPLALQVAIGGHVLAAHAGPLVRAVGLAGGALALVDRWAIRRNVWVLAPALTLPDWGRGWHPEEVLFFLLAAALCANGLTLALWADHGFEPRLRIAGVALGRAHKTKAA